MGPVFFALAIHPVFKEAQQVTEISHTGGRPMFLLRALS